MTQVFYRYSELDKGHCYYIKHAENAFDSWVWFYLGMHIKYKGEKAFRLYPFVPTWIDTRLLKTAKVNDAEWRGEIIAKAINTHYEKAIKKRKL